MLEPFAPPLLPIFYDGCSWPFTINKLTYGQMLTTVFQCIPISALWNQYDPVNPPDPSTFECSVKIHPLFIGKSVPHIATDILILLFPLPYIWNLQLRLSQKIAMSVIFGLGTL